MPYEGKRLFVKALDDIISKSTGGKSTFRPQTQRFRESTKKQSDTFFRRRNDARSYRPGREYRASTWCSGQNTFFKSPRVKQTRSPKSTAKTTPVGARLSAFQKVWTTEIQDAWVVSIIQRGYRLEFRQKPLLNHFVSTILPRDSQRRDFLFHYVQQLILKQAVTLVSPPEQGRGFYSLLFLITKATGDLRMLNRYLKRQTFKMETLATIKSMIRPGDWLASLDLKDAYLHIPIALEHQRFLRFCLKDQHYQFRCLPFGLATSPRTFTKVLVVIIAKLRGYGIEIYHYLDDLLLVARDPTILRSNLQRTKEVLERFGCIVNLAKSQVVPSQRMIYLGAQIDTLLGLVTLPRKKIDHIMLQVSQFKKKLTTSAKKFMSLLGLLTSPNGLVRWAKWKMRPIQLSFLNQWNSVNQNWSQTIQITAKCKRQLSWWMIPSNLRGGLPLESPNWIELYTDASGSGEMEGRPFEDPVQHLGAQSNFSGTCLLQGNSPGFCCQSEDRQCCCSSLHQRTRWNKKQVTPQRSPSDYGMGSTPSLRPDSPICSRYGECGSRLSQSDTFAQGGVGIESSSVLVDNLHLGLSGSRSDGDPFECQTSSVLLQSPLSRCSGSGCFFTELGRSICVHFPSDSDHPENPDEDPSIQNDGYCNSPRLAEEALVSLAEEPVGISPIISPTDRGFVDSGQMGTSRSSKSQSKGLEVERRILKELGCSEAVINTLLKARKHNTMCKYHKIWDTFRSWAVERSLDPMNPSVGNILDFLQAGLDKGLSLSTLKGKISALSAILEKRWAKDPLIVRFFQAINRIRPPRKNTFPAWDLPLTVFAAI
uniref:ribonuclease H n=1 Tax=Xenopus tropicalis TaxID=8364 RepID=A0A803K510_XENTR